MVDLVGVATLVKQAEKLSLEDQLALMAQLAQAMQQRWQPTAIPRRWREIRGVVQAPLVGEDAQTWVSRTRQVGDEQIACALEAGCDAFCSNDIQLKRITEIPMLILTELTI